MFKSSKGFTLIELMIVVVIIGILAAIAIPNFIAMTDRAKEGSTKANMHTFQLSAEDYGVQYDGAYADDASQVAALLPTAGLRFENPFSGTTANSWEDRGSYTADPSATSGVVSYADSLQVNYDIKGVGRVTSGIGFPLNLELTSGE